MPATPHILFAGGGALSHVYPGLAIAEHLQRQLASVQITFAGAGRASERHIVRMAGRNYTAIPTHPTPRNPLQAIRFVTDNLAGYCAARWMLREQRVSLVVSLGGSTSLAVVRAAVDRGLPFVIFEQNAIASRTTRWLSRAAAMVCAGFEEVRPYLHVQAPVTVTGSPARTSFEDLYVRLHARQPIAKSLRDSNQPVAKSLRDSNQPVAESLRDSNQPVAESLRDSNQPVAESLRDSKSMSRRDTATSSNNPRRQRRLVILGGAAGARTLNEAIPTALAKIGSPLAAWQIVHQTGDGQLQETEARYAQLGLRALTVTHIDEPAPVLFDSDLVVCRAAGTTLAELALAGVPAIVVPYPRATDNHQAENARIFAAAGACRVIHESARAASPNTAASLDAALANELEPLVVDHRLRQEMAERMHAMARPQAAAQIAAVVANQICGHVVSLLAA